MEFIGIGIHVDTAIMPKAYFNHLAAIGLWSNKYKLKLIGMDRMKVAAARNRITDKAIKEGCSHILFIDSDHLVPFDMLDKLLESKDSGMISGLIYRRSYPFTPVVFKKDHLGRMQEAIINPGTKVLEVDACAMGCTLINLSFVKRLPKPYWIDDHFRSDIMMCDRIKILLGGKIYVDTRIIVRHLGDQEEIGPENVDEFRARSHKEKLNES